MPTANPPTAPPPIPLARRPLRFGLGAGLAAAARGLALAVLGLAGVVPLLALLLGPGLVALGVGFLVAGPGAPGQERVLLGLLTAGAGAGIARFGTVSLLLGLRRLAGLTRRLAGSWCGVPVASPYRPLPASRDELRFTQLLRWLATDPATWRDLLWAAVSLVAGWILAACSAVVTGIGLIAFIGPELVKTIPPPAFAGNSGGSLIVLGLAIAAAGVAAAPLLLRGYGLLARSMLAPPGRADLTRRITHLAVTRDKALDTSAAEIRRIERDLHDGAQARLIAMGMTLDAAGQVIDTNPEAARALLYEARDASVKALAELRDLVRGIHPPVLADRGLADAVRALALDSALRVDLASDLNGRPPAPVESAAYFAVSELLANVAKHAAARQAWIDIRHTGGMLRIGVTDDGHGGAAPKDPRDGGGPCDGSGPHGGGPHSGCGPHGGGPHSGSGLHGGGGPHGGARLHGTSLDGPAGGTGLRGIEQRLAAFDGVLAISSPPGGPTSVTMEIPCALSSPKTSSC